MMKKTDKKKRKVLIKPIPKDEKNVCLYGEGNENCLFGCG